MAIANELSGEVAVALLALAGSKEDRDKTKMKEILVNFYSALRPLTAASRRRYTRARIASPPTSGDQPASESH